MQKLKIAAALIGVNLALLLLLELGCRVFFDNVIVYDLEMTRYGRDVKIRAENPLIGHVHRPNARRHLMGVDVATNSDGFRDLDYPVERNGAHRMIVLGDSLTFGWGVDFEKTFSRVLERRLNSSAPVEVINFGAGNYNTQQEVNLLIDKGLKYQPDHVVLFYFINDAEPTPKRASWSFLDRSELVSIFWSRLRIAKGRLFGSQSYIDYYKSLYADDAPGWQATREALELLRDTCAREGIRLQVVLLPELHQLEDYTFEREHRLVTEYLESLEIATLDLAPHFAGETDPPRLWVALDDAHPNAAAHGLIADYSESFISKDLTW
jgi:lysophospholipase L1-like esterase